VLPEKHKLSLSRMVFNVPMFLCCPRNFSLAIFMSCQHVQNH